MRVVISELQAEHLAAGTRSSPHDFEVSGATAWVPVPVASSQGRADAYLHGVNTEHGADEELAEAAREQKKKTHPI
jgi:hypothetical protein